MREQQELVRVPAQIENLAPMIQIDESFAPAADELLLTFRLQLHRAGDVRDERREQVFLFLDEDGIRLLTVEHDRAERLAVATANDPLEVVVQVLRAPDLVVQRCIVEAGAIELLRAADDGASQRQIREPWHRFALAPVVELVEVELRDRPVDRALEEIALDASAAIDPVEQVARRRDDGVHCFEQRWNEQFAGKAERAEIADGRDRSCVLHSCASFRMAALERARCRPSPLSIDRCGPFHYPHRGGRTRARASPYSLGARRPCVLRRRGTVMRRSCAATDESPRPKRGPGAAGRHPS